MSDISLVIINFGSPELVQRMLASLSAHEDRELIREVVVVDTGYPEKGDSRDAIDPSHYPFYPFPVSFVQNEQRSYASGCNRGVEATTGSVVAISNNDIMWTDTECPRPPRSVLEQDDQVFVVGPQLLFSSGDWQRSYGPFPSILRALSGLLFWESIGNALEARRFRKGKSRKEERVVEYVDGAFLAMRRHHFDVLGGFDEAYHFYADEVDLCWRARLRGWKNVTVPEARIVHVRGATATKVAPVDFSVRIHAATCAFVSRNFGPLRGKVFDVLQRIGALERAAVYSAIATVVRTPGSRRRAEGAGATAKAAVRQIDWKSGW